MTQVFVWINPFLACSNLCRLTDCPWSVYAYTRILHVLYMTHPTASFRFLSYSLFAVQLSDVTQTELLAARFSDAHTNINHSKETVIWSNPILSSEWAPEPLHCSDLEQYTVIL